jgi:threonine dehydrogenase-like Zn-dependent dehydrogenase
MARAQGAEIINFDKEDPVKMLKTLTGEIGADRAIDAVGVDSVHAHHGPAAKQAQKQEKEFQRQQKQAMQGKQPKAKDGNWVPGDAPLQAASWAVEALAKAGTLAIIGVYPETVETFPLGKAMNKNLTMKMGNCDHRRIIPKLVELVRAKAIDPRKILTKREPLTSAIDAFKAFDQRQPGWMKVELVPGQKAKEEWAPAAQI